MGFNGVYIARTCFPDAEVNFNVPTPGPSPISSPKPVKKHKPGRQIYIRACKKFLLTPIKSIRDGLKKEQLVCKYTTLREKDVEAVVLALVVTSTWSRGYKTFFMLSSAEHKISTAHKC